MHSLVRHPPVTPPRKAALSNAVGFVARPLLMNPRLRLHAAGHALGAAARPRRALFRARPTAHAIDPAPLEPTASSSASGVRRRAQPEGYATRAAAGHDRAAAFALWTSAGWNPDDADDAHDTEVVVARDRQHGRVVGAGRTARSGQNVEIGRVFVLDEFRGRGFGRMLVEKLMELAAPIRGALHVQATRDELGFYSILGFETQGNEYMLGGDVCRHMVYRVPVCAPATDCVGLHHTAIRVVDIERSLAFYGILGFVVSEKFFTPAGARACFVEGLGVRLELVESTTGAGVAGVQYWPGFLTFDVTKIAVSLDTWLDNLHRRNGGILTITAEPANQVVGSNVMSIATIEDPDGLPIDFIRLEGQIPSALKPRVNW